MTSEDFAKIFYSNFSPAIDWANIDEIAWMYKEGLFTLSSTVVASNDEYIKRIDLISNSKGKLLKSGENEGHLVLKSFATDYLIKSLGVKEVLYEYHLIGFEVDVIDKDLHFPTECGDCNALKLEKYLYLPSTQKMLIVPYPHLGEVTVFEFYATPRFFDYIQHKQNFLNQKNAKLR